MSEEADRAYEAALKIIRNAMETGSEEVIFDEANCRSLKRLPDEIVNLKHVKEIDLRYIEISDIKGLSLLPKLERLALDGVTLTSFSSLSEISSLRDLSLTDSNITDLSPLSNLKKLRSLWLDRTKISHLAPLMGLPELSELNIDGTMAIDLRPLIDVPRLGTYGSGLSIKDSIAAYKDHQLAELSLLKDPQVRTQEIINYLKSLPHWPEPYKVKSIPTEFGKMTTINFSDGVEDPEVRSSMRDLEEIISRQKSRINDLELEEQMLFGRFEKSLKSLFRKAVDIDRALAQQNEVAKLLEKKFKSFEDDIEGIKQSYSEETRQAAPVALWEEKRVEHRKAQTAHFWLFFASMLAIGFSATLGVNYLVTNPDAIDLALAPVGCNQAAPETCKGFSGRSLLFGATILTFFTILLWFTRLQMKLYLAERHLALDARERIAFSRSYVGLLAEGDTSEEAKQQRSLVYAALFRPSSDGAIKEEGGLDPAISAAISKLLTK